MIELVTIQQPPNVVSRYVCMYVYVTRNGMIIVTYKGFCDIKLYDMNTYDLRIIVF